MRYSISAGAAYHILKIFTLRSYESAKVESQILRHTVTMDSTTNLVFST